MSEKLIALVITVAALLAMALCALCLEVLRKAIEDPPLANLPESSEPAVGDLKDLSSD